MKEKMTRREFLTAAGATAALAAVGAGCAGKARKASAAAVKFGSPKGIENKLVVASGTNIEAGISSALDKLGGIGKFIRRGDKVVLKPNGAWAREPGQGATTNPDVLRVVALMCKKAGASEVIIVEHTIDRPAAMVLAMSGISEAARKAGAKLISAGDESMYGEIAIPKGVVLQKDQVARAVLDADVFINLPVAKDHSQTRLSLGMKNLMGIVWDRTAWHASPDINQCIADFSSVLRPTLTILDATTMLLSGGPKGPGRTKKENKIVVGADPVAVDAYGATLFGLDPVRVEHIALAHKMGVGEIDLDNLEILKV